MRTQLGIHGSEQSGPQQSASALLQMIKEKAGDA